MKQKPAFQNQFLYLIIVLLICDASVTRAVTRAVPSKYPTIQAAINAASVSGDTVLVSSGIYKGIGNVNIDTLHKAVIIKSVSGATSCIIDGGGNSQIFYIHSGELKSTMINGFTLQNGNSQDGGAIEIRDSSPTVTGCLFTHNKADYSGGACVIFLPNTAYAPVFSNNTFYNNTAGYYGGGMLVQSGAAIVTNCIYSNNYAVAYRGGGVFVSASDKTKFTNCTFNYNNAPLGGGAHSENQSLSSYTNCTFNNNSAQAGGGSAVYGGSLSVYKNCTFYANSAATGGGVYMQYSNASPAFTNCTFENNTAVQGAGMRIDQSNPNITNCEFISNNATSTNVGEGGGGLFISQSAGLTAPKIKGCLFYTNSASNDGGGILNYGNPTITNCFLYGNTAAINGGGVESTNGIITLVNCVVEFNVSSFGSGGGLYLVNSPTFTYITGCSFYGNSSTNYGDAVYGANACTILINNSIVYDSNHSSIGYDIVTDGTPSIIINYSDIYGGWGGSGAHNINANPLYNDPSDGYLNLQNGSPCINKANIVAPGYISKDILGITRGGSAPDMGAYENNTL